MNRIMIVCSTSFYEFIEPIKDKLVEYGYEVVLPNSYGEEDEVINTKEELTNFYKRMYLESRNKISNIDELLVLNFDKNKNGIVKKNYIGASTFLEMYESFMNDKKIYLYTDLPGEDNMLYEDITAMNPIILHENIELIKE